MKGFRNFILGIITLISCASLAGFGGRAGGFRGGSFSRGISSSGSRGFSFGRSSTASRSISTFGGSSATRNAPIVRYSNPQYRPPSPQVDHHTTVVNNGGGGSGFFTGMMLGHMMNRPTTVVAGGAAVAAPGVAIAADPVVVSSGPSIFGMFMNGLLCVAALIFLVWLVAWVLNKMNPRNRGW